eukprot:Gb_17288 [translate_table: standard]
MADSSGFREDLVHLLHGSDPVTLELSRLENQVKGKNYFASETFHSIGMPTTLQLNKDRELGEAHAEIKALKLTERLKEKALEELTDQLTKVEAKLKASESLIENKNLEIKKTNDEKKAALAAQFAAEASLRRVHVAQKDDEMPPIETLLAPLDAELKVTRHEEDNKVLERLTRSKEVALLEAERTVQIALAKAKMVEDLQNKNQELTRQIEICQEENKILDKMHRQKVSEIEKLSQTVCDLEEAVLARGVAANAVRDYQRRVNEFAEEKKTLERELARAKIAANRVAVAVANEWKDDNDKVIPLKQWLEERRFMQGEMQQLRDKLALAERTAKTEAQLKEKLKLRLKVLEEGLKASSNLEGQRSSNGTQRLQSTGGVEYSSKFSTNGLGFRRASVSELRECVSSNASSVLKDAKETSESFDGVVSLDTNISSTKGSEEQNDTKKVYRVSRNTEVHNTGKENSERKPPEIIEASTDDSVSGILYDILQKEVITLRKACCEKDQCLKDKDDAIKLLSKKVDTLTKSKEADAKKMRREVAAMGKEVATLRFGKDHEQRIRRSSSFRGPTNSSQLVSGSNWKS